MMLSAKSTNSIGPLGFNVQGLLHLFVCLIVATTLLLSGVAVISLHDNNEDAASSGKRNPHAAFTPAPSSKFHAAMDSDCSHDGCNALCHMMESIRTGLHLPEIDPAVVRFAVHVIPDDFLLYSRPFKPPR